jgi:hypothetical protein
VASAKFQQDLFTREHIPPVSARDRSGMRSPDESERGTSYMHVAIAAFQLETRSIAPTSARNSITPDALMPNRPPSRQAARRSKAMLLPMGRDRASNLILHTRLFLERALRGDIDRGLINHFAHVCILSRYVARAGYATLPKTRMESLLALRIFSR